GTKVGSDTGVRRDYVVVLLTVVGIVLFVLGLLFSIAWHELGHLSTAKMFGITCTEYMVGFGKTLWSFRRDGTKHGIKAVALRGYARMVGMLPPAIRTDDTGAKKMSRWRAVGEDAREACYIEFAPEEQDGQFYQRAPWRQIIGVLAGRG